MIVLKFGGTSVQSAERINGVIDIAESQLNDAPLVVASAMGKTTDKLVAIEQEVQKAKSGRPKNIISEIEDLHYATAKALLTGKLYEKGCKALDALFKELNSLVTGLHLLGECTDRSRDALLSFGERLSTTLIALRAEERGIYTELLDSRKLIITDDEFSKATPLMENTIRAIEKNVNAESGKLLVAQGFIASTTQGITTTLGRGGSDYSATIFGAALQAEAVQIWTDVNGIMTTDPRIVPEAKTVDEISYDEASELAYFGAKVVHPSTIQPAVETHIAVQVKNTQDPDGPFTSIIPEPRKKGIRAIAAKKEVTLININSSRMLNAYGFLQKIFSIFEKHTTPVDLIATSEVSVSMTIEDASYIDQILKDLSTYGIVNIEHDCSIICLVGHQLWKDSQFIADIFSSITDIPIRMISLGSSDTNLSLVVPDDYAERVISQLHSRFFHEH